jgi:hypothetical protein
LQQVVSAERTQQETLTSDDDRARSPLRDL